MTVICIHTETDDLSPGDSYQVRGSSGLSLRIENDAGEVRYYPADWFELV